MSDILLYCGISEKAWNGYPITPGGYGCVSPVSGRTARTKKENCLYVPSGTEIIQDSGAFSDSWSERLTFTDTLKRQEKHAAKYGYEGYITHRATYDVLIDEVWTDGNREKRRWTVADAESAVDESVEAARWLNDHRNGLNLIISGQGVDAQQYLRCVKRLLPLFRDGDVLGLGGWCIIGKMPRRMIPVFRETVDLIIPFIASEGGIKRVHVWGVIYPPALSILFSKCREHGIAVSTDSAGVNLNPVYGQWGYGSWRDNRYQRPDSGLIGEHRALHATLTRRWLDGFAGSVDYVTFCRSALSHFAAAQQESVTRRVESLFPDMKTGNICECCGKAFETARRHAATCSAACRKAKSRQNKNG